MQSVQNGKPEVRHEMLALLLLELRVFLHGTEHAVHCV